MAFQDSLTDLMRVSQSLMDHLDGMPVDMSGRVVNPIPFDMAELPDGLVLQAYLPGFRREDISVEISDRRLAIKAERHLPRRDDLTWLHVEAPYGTFLRTVGLGTDIDADHIEAGWNEGVLTLRLPKAEEARPRQIPVNTAADIKLDEMSKLQS